MASNFARYMIHVANIPWTVGRHELTLYFSRFGYIQDASIAFDKQTGLHQGYGHVTFLKKGSLDTALSHKHFLEGNNLTVSAKNYNEFDRNNDI